MIRFCAAPGCPRRVVGFADLCATHHSMLPTGQARLLRQMRIAQFHARDEDTRNHLVEQHAGYIAAAVSRLQGAVR